jgi:L-lactate dehydrogenase (cytochrome)
MTVINSIADLRQIAMRRVPRAIFDYADRGSWDEITIARNRSDLMALKLRQRVMIDVANRSTATTLAGQDASFPLAIGPTGLTGLFHHNGEVAGLRAAAAAGIPFCLSTLAIASIEDLREATDAPFWFQLYLMRDRGFNADLIARAQRARCPVLMLTADLQVQGLRRRDAKNGLAIPPRLGARTALDMLRRPRWLWGLARSKRRGFGNLEPLMGTDSLQTLSQWIAGQFDPTVTWKDAAWVRERWPGKFVIKGILDADDARSAVAAGADAIVVSNHGGRQLDSAPSTISVLPRIVDAVGGRCEVLLDGGVQTGQDILKALALGARGALIGKAFLYSLAAGGERGVRQGLGILRAELDTSMALCGLTDVHDAGPTLLAP